MSDEERKDEEQDVEAHTGSLIKPTSPEAKAADDEGDEPDVEAHSRVRPQAPTRPL